MSERFGPRTIDPDLVQDLWREIKVARDKMFNWQLQARHGQERLEKILDRMKDTGMADWLPTLEEVQAAWAEDGGESMPPDEPAGDP